MALGTGGFLIETLEHLSNEAMTSVANREKVHSSIRGFEKKPLPYLLSTMNLLLHEVESPRISLANSLQTLIGDKSAASRVGVILTNPPFGGAEDNEVAKAFPKEAQTAETAWLFLHLVMEKLEPGGRCGIVVPNSVLFDAGVGARIKKRLMETCDLHTIVRLPEGVFAPYTDIPSNLLFFEKGRPTRETWFYQISPPEGQKKYTKTRPIRFDEFTACQSWWGGRHRTGRSPGPNSWCVDAETAAESEYNLGLRNPSAERESAPLVVADLLKELHTLECELTARLEDLQRMLTTDDGGRIRMRPMSEVLELRLRPVEVEAGADYQILGVYSYGRGMLRRGTISGEDTAYSRLFRVEENDLVLSRLKAFEGAIAVAGRRSNGGFVSAEFPTFTVKTSVCSVSYLRHMCRWPGLWGRLAGESRGLGSRRERVSANRLLATEVPLPTVDEQRRIATLLDAVAEYLDISERRRNVAANLLEIAMNVAFAGKL